MPSFSRVNVHGSPPRSQSDPDGAKDYVQDTIKQMRQISMRSLDRWCLTHRDQNLIDAIIGRSLTISNDFASNLRLRSRLSRFLIDELDKMSETNPHRRFMLVTLISDRWLAYDRDVYIWLGGMQQAIRKVMPLGGFDGWFGMIEIQSLSEGERGLGRLLLPHFHAVAWTDDAVFDVVQAEARMRSSRRLVTATGAPTVTVNHHSETHAVNLGAYIMKAPSVAKHRVPSRHSKAGFTLEPTELAPISAVRLLEILSAVAFDELMLSGGNGKFLKVALKRLIATSNVPTNGLVEMDQTNEVWQGIRKRVARDKNYYPVAIDRSGAQLPADCPISLSCPRLQEWIGKRKVRENIPDPATS